MRPIHSERGLASERRAFDPRPLAAWGIIVLLFAVALGRAAGDPAAPQAQREAIHAALPRMALNALSEEEWCLLPGIGPALAARIVAHRQAHGPFRSVEHLARVPGIGPRTIERLAPLLTTEVSPKARSAAPAEAGPRRPGP